ncbi:MAG: anti-anti-sigma factor [Gammaproteobacteria bacterium]|jgi:anti-anti-sigma factor
MTVLVDSGSSTREITISIDGRFDFSQHEAFRTAFEQLPSRPARYVVDLARAEAMDSAGLGMLLLLRDRVGGDPKELHVVNCTDPIREVLRIACFDTLLTVD